MEWAGIGFLCAKSLGWNNVIPRTSDSDSPTSSPATAAATSALSPSWVETGAWLFMAVAEVIQAVRPTQAELFPHHALHHDAGKSLLTRITIVAFVTRTDCPLLTLTKTRVDMTHHTSS